MLFEEWNGTSSSKGRKAASTSIERGKRRGEKRTNVLSSLEQDELPLNLDLALLRQELLHIFQPLAVEDKEAVGGGSRPARAKSGQLLLASVVVRGLESSVGKLRGERTACQRTLKTRTSALQLPFWPATFTRPGQLRPFPQSIQQTYPSLAPVLVDTSVAGWRDDGGDVRVVAFKVAQVQLETNGIGVDWHGGDGVGGLGE
jgi:hypothetical protein